MADVKFDSPPPPYNQGAGGPPYPPVPGGMAPYPPAQGGYPPTTVYYPPPQPGFTVTQGEWCICVP